jgi:hypothetical protein
MATQFDELKELGIKTTIDLRKEENAEFYFNLVFLLRELHYEGTLRSESLLALKI